MSIFKRILGFVEKDGNIEYTYKDGNDVKKKLLPSMEDLGTAGGVDRKMLIQSYMTQVFQEFTDSTSDNGFRRINLTGLPTEVGTLAASDLIGIPIFIRAATASTYATASVNVKVEGIDLMTEILNFPSTTGTGLITNIPGENWVRIGGIYIVLWDGTKLHMINCQDIKEGTNIVPGIVRIGATPSDVTYSAAIPYAQVPINTTSNLNSAEFLVTGGWAFKGPNPSSTNFPGSVRPLYLNTIMSGVSPTAGSQIAYIRNSGEIWHRQYSGTTFQPWVQLTKADGGIYLANDSITDDMIGNRGDNTIPDPESDTANMTAGIKLLAWIKKIANGIRNARGRIKTIETAIANGEIAGASLSDTVYQELTAGSHTDRRIEVPQGTTASDLRNIPIFIRANHGADNTITSSVTLNLMDIVSKASILQVSLNFSSLIVNNITTNAPPIWVRSGQIYCVVINSSGNTAHVLNPQPGYPATSDIPGLVRLSTETTSATTDGAVTMAVRQQRISSPTVNINDTQFLSNGEWLIVCDTLTNSPISVTCVNSYKLVASRGIIANTTVQQILTRLNDEVSWERSVQQNGASWTFGPWKSSRDVFIGSNKYESTPNKLSTKGAKMTYNDTDQCIDITFQ